MVPLPAVPLPEGGYTGLPVPVGPAGMAAPVPYGAAYLWQTRQCHRVEWLRAAGELAYCADAVAARAPTRARTVLVNCILMVRSTSISRVSARYEEVDTW